MIFFVLGGTGRIGGLFITEALSKGHKVVALVRSRNRLSIENHPNLKILEGTPESREDIMHGLEGCDAVINALAVARTGEWPWAPLISAPDFVSKTIQIVLEEMKAKGITRILSVSDHNVGLPWRDVPMVLKFILSKSNIKHAYEDNIRQEKILSGSDMEWTAVRARVLSSKPTTSDMIVSIGGVPSPFKTTAREHVAKFMLQEAQENKFVRQAPSITGR